MTKELDNNTPVMILIMLLLSIVFYTLVTLYAWPLRIVQDGKSRSLFYFCDTNYWTQKDESGDSKTVDELIKYGRSLVKNDEQGILLEEEKNPDVELPEL